MSDTPLTLEVFQKEIAVIAGRFSAIDARLDAVRS